MKVFEYMQIDSEGYNFNDNTLKKIGEHGWEMCGVSQNLSYGNAIWNNYYFKREAGPPAEFNEIMASGGIWQK